MSRAEQQATYLFKGVLTAHQPLAVSPPSATGRNDNGPRKLPRMPIFSSATRRDVAYFPATTIRGKLRRCARDVARDAVIATTGDPKPWDLQTHFFNTIGGVKGKGKEQAVSVLEEEERRIRNPLLSLFGAGDPFVHGLAQVGNALPSGPEDQPIAIIGAGVRTDDLRRDSSQTRFLTADALTQYVRLTEGNRDRVSLKAREKELRTQVRKATGDAKAALTKELDDVASQLKQQEGETGATSMLMPLAGFEAICQGTVMDHQIRLVRVTPVELGLFLAALDRFTMQPLLGAHAALGCGEAGMAYEVSKVTKDGAVVVGRVTADPYAGLQLDDLEGTELTAAVDAWATAAAEGKLDFRALQGQSSDSDE